jgi:hypothetical protein
MQRMVGFTFLISIITSLHFEKNICFMTTPLDVTLEMSASLSRPFGQKTNLLSQHHQGFGIVT